MRFFAIATLMALFALPARAALKVGDKAPNVSAPLSDGSTFKMSEWLAKAPLVIYFYPKDGKFIEKYELPFPLMSDEKHAVAKAFGVNGTVFAKRSTFIIGKDGKIIYGNPSVDPKVNSKEIRDFLSTLPR